MAEPVEKLHLLFGVAAERLVGCKPGDEFADAGAQLIGEVRGRWADKGIDLRTCRCRTHSGSLDQPFPSRWRLRPAASAGGRGIGACETISG
jgi:hypothetical protein